MTESLLVTPATGTSLRRSEQVAVLPSTLTASASSESVVKVITAMCLSLMDETLNSDSMAMAMMDARKTAVEAGVPDAQAKELINTIGRTWLARRSRNPLSSLF